MEAYIAANYQNQSAMSMLCYRFGKYEDVALGKHQVFAVAEIITRNLDVEVWEGSAASLYKRIDEIVYA